jgi:hypothetical protein
MADSLAITFTGKTDAGPVTLYLFTNWTHPNLCPVKALLLYLHLTKYKSGYLFPPISDIQTALDDPDFDGHYDISTFTKRSWKTIKGSAI